MAAKPTYGVMPFDEDSLSLEDIEVFIDCYATSADLFDIQRALWGRLTSFNTFQPITDRDDNKRTEAVYDELLQEELTRIIREFPDPLKALQGLTHKEG